MDHRVGVGVSWVDAKGLRQPAAIVGLDRGETKPPVFVAAGDEADPARAKHADAVVEDHVIVGPREGAFHHRLSNVSSATIIKTIAGPVLTSAPSGSIHRSGVRIAAPIM